MAGRRLKCRPGTKCPLNGQEPWLVWEVLGKGCWVIHVCLTQQMGAFWVSWLRVFAVGRIAVPHCGVEWSLELLGKGFGSHANWQH